MKNKMLYNSVLLCCLVSAVVFSAVSGVSAGEVVLTCINRIESSKVGTVYSFSSTSAKIGEYCSGSGTDYEYRVYAEFDISQLTDKTVTDVKFEVFNDWNGDLVADLWYMPRKYGEALQEDFFSDRDSGFAYTDFSWSIQTGGNWTLAEYSDFDWENQKRTDAVSGSGFSLIEDLQTHIDNSVSWFAVQFGRAECSPQRANLFFPQDTANPASIRMIVEYANEPFVKEKNFGPSPCISAGNPINFATGNKYETQTDIVLSGPGLPMQYVRYYNSQSDNNGYQGYGWTGSFSEHIIPETGKITLIEADGREVWFFDDLFGTYFSETGEIRKIIKNAVTQEYTLTEPDGKKMIFNSAGELKQISDRNGNTQTLTYSGGKLSLVRDDNFGRQFTFSYNGTGRLDTLGTPAGNFTYTYDTSGNLTKVTRPDTFYREYEYLNPSDHNLTGITDENNIPYVTFTYENGLAVSSAYAGDSKGTEIIYPADMTSPARTVSDPLSNERQFSVSEQSGIGKVGKASGSGCSTCPFSSGNSISYTEAGYLPETVTDAEGNTASYIYDGRGNILSMSEAEETAQARTTSFTWHTDYSFPLSITRPSVSGGTVTDLYGYDGNGNLETLTENSGTASARTTSFSWDSYGRMTGIDGPRTDVSDTVTFTWYPAASGGHLQSITDAENHVTLFSNYNAFGKPGRMTDPNNVITDFGYDTMGRMTSKTVAGITTGYAYDNVGNLKEITFPGSRKIFYEYTDAGRLEKIKDNSGNYILYEYDTEGNRTGEDIHDSGGTLKKWTDYSYDNHNRLEQILYPGTGSPTEIFGYDGNNNLKSYTDGNGKSYSYIYDALQRMTSATAPGSIATGSEYDAADNLKKVTDARTNATDYIYDDLGNMLSADSPDSGSTAYGYDSAGNMTSRTDANNITVTYDYDALNRLTDMNFPDSLQDISYGYDSGTYGKGKLTSVSDPEGNTSFDYNALGQITQETRTDGSLVFDTVYGYDTVTADLNALTYPSGLALTYQRDTNGRISGISADGQSIVGNVIYLPFGPVSGMTMGSLSVTRTFDQRYQVSGIQIDIPSGTVMNLTYIRDGAGNVKSISGVTKAPVAPGTTDYTLPSDSNLLSGSSGQTVKTYAYDAAGNITSDGTRTFTCNQDHRLIRVSAGQTVIAEYAYDGFGRRVKKTVGSEITYFHYDYDGNLISETDGSGSPLRDYIYLNGEPVAMKLYGTGAGWYYFLNDHLGTPQKMTDASGTVVWEAGYMPFGEARILLADIENNLRFPGQYYDKETGLHYNYHRYYDPDTGRYLTPDPIGLEGGINLYVYVNGNPVNWSDPEGMSPAGLIVKYSKKVWNHVFKRHVNRKAFPGKSKFKDPSSIRKNVEKTVKNFDRRTPQNNGRVLYEKDFGKEIGINGETIQRVALDRYDNMVTTFPSTTFKAITIGLLSILDPFDAISGELSDPEEDIDGNGVPDYMEKKPNLGECY